MDVARDRVRDVLDTLDTAIACKDVPQAVLLAMREELTRALEAMR